MFGLRVAQYGLLLVANVLASRSLGTAGRAEYALPLNLATLVWIAVNLSLDSSVGAMLARREASILQLSRLLTTATLALGALGVALTLAIGLPTANSLLAHAPPAAIAFAAVGVPLALAVQLATGLLVRIGALRGYGLATFVGSAFQLIVVIALVASGRLTPALAVAASTVGSLTIAALLVATVARRIGVQSLVPKIEPALVRRALRSGVAVHPATLALQLNLRIDLLIVSVLLSAHQAGLYSLATSLVSVLYLALWTLSASSAQAQTEAGLESANRYTLAFVRGSWMLASLVALGLAAVAWPLIRLIFGAAWTGSVVPFMILASATIVLSIEAPLRVMLMRMHRARWISAASCVAMLVNVGLNFVLIPALGIVGAALASVASYSLYAISMLVLFGRASGLDIRTVWRPTLDPLVSLASSWTTRRLADARRTR